MASQNTASFAKSDLTSLCVHALQRSETLPSYSDRAPLAVDLRSNSQGTDGLRASSESLGGIRRRAIDRRLEQHLRQRGAAGAG